MENKDLVPGPANSVPFWALLFLLSQRVQVPKCRGIRSQFFGTLYYHIWVCTRIEPRKELQRKVQVATSDAVWLEVLTQEEEKLRKQMEAAEASPASWAAVLI